MTRQHEQHQKVYPCPVCGMELYHHDHKEKPPWEKGLSDIDTALISEVCHCPICGWEGSIQEIKDLKITHELG